MNKLFDYLIDWTRVGELLRSGSHRYSFNELVPRFFVASITLSPLMYRLNIDLRVAGEMFLCFTISHLIVISPLVAKRWRCREECKQLILEIKTRRCKCRSTIESIDKTLYSIDTVCTECTVCRDIKRIMESKALRDKASATWGQRKRMLQELLEHELINE